MSEESEPPPIPSQQTPPTTGLGGFAKTVIALIPAIIAHVVAGIAGATNMAKGDLIIAVCVVLLVAGALLAGTLLVLGLKRRSPQLHVLVLILIFLAVAGLYFTVFFFTGCVTTLLFAS